MWPLRAMRPRSPTHKPSTQDENLARETEKCLRSKFVGAVLWLRFIAVNAHVRGLG